MDTNPLQQAFAARYSDAPNCADDPRLHAMATRGSCRAFTDQPVPDEILQILCATALASPTKSDLQQRDIILLKSPTQRAKLATLVAGQTWIAEAPMIAVFCGNNRRQRLIHDWHDIPFANDHFDAAFNAIGDAAIALGAFVAAADAIGLGTCPISAVRNEADQVSDLLKLPQHVFPFAGLAIGYPANPPRIAMRLPLDVTCHTDHYQENGLQMAIDDYDQARAAQQPYRSQRATDQYGTKDPYTWSDDKARQYGQPERADFGEFMKRKGFRLE